MARSQDNYSVIIDARRLPIGKRNGALKAYAAHQLGGIIIQSILRDAKAIPDEVIMGNMIHTGVTPIVDILRPRPNPAQEALFWAGYGNLKGVTVDRARSSALQAVIEADRAIRSRDCNTMLAGGMESMSRFNKDFLRMVFRDPSDLPGSASLGYTTVEAGEWCANTRSISRKRQDGWAITSYQRAREAQEKGYCQNHIIPVGLVAQDEEPTTPTDENAIRSAKPILGENATVTKSSASKNGDSAAAVTLMHAAHAKRLGLQPLARIIAHASSQTASGDPRQFTIEPPVAIREAIKRAGLLLQQIGLYEINAAFSSVVLYSIDELGIPEDRINIHGDAVSQCHPVGASGAIRLVELVYALMDLDIRFGAVGVCHALGGATAMVIENLRMR